MSGYNRKTNLRVLAYESFIHNLLIGKLRPGQFVSQRELVGVTGVSLAAVREAVPRLEAEKLLETVPQRGMQIAKVDLRMMKEVFQLWMVLARAAAEMFNQSASGEVLDELQLMHKDILLRASRLPDPSLLEDARQLERHFHELLIAAFDNAMICDIYRVDSIKIDMIRRLRGQDEFDEVLHSTNERLRIIEALKRREVKQVIHAVEEHVESTLHRAVVFLGGGVLHQGPPMSVEDGIIAA